MTGRQYFNLMVVRLGEFTGKRLPRVALSARRLSALAFPDFAAVDVAPELRSHRYWPSALAAYFVLFVLLWLVQAVWAARNGMFWPDHNNQTRTFLEDIPDQINYLVICETYAIFGLVFLRQAYTLRSDLIRSGALPEPASPSRPRWGSMLGILLVLLISCLASAGYALEVQKYSRWYWFMSSGPPHIVLGGAGYYYLLVNALMMLLVVWVAFAHLGMITVGGEITSTLQIALETNDRTQLAAWEDEHEVRKRLRPLAWHIVIAKAFILFLMLNLVVWRVQETGVGKMYILGVFLAGIVGIWLFSLPRYSIQLWLLRIRENAGKADYRDLREPWPLGLSALLDVLLLSYGASFLLGDAVRRFLDQLGS